MVSMNKPYYFTKNLENYILDVMRYKKYHIIGIAAGLLIIIWLLTHQRNNSNKRMLSALDLTVIIPEFEHFEHNIVDTVKSIIELDPSVPILVLSTKTPYPHFKLPQGNVKVVVTKKDAQVPAYMGDPVYHIKTKHSLIIPDGARINIALDTLLRKLSMKSTPIVALPVGQKLTECNLMQVSLKEWTLKYLRTEKLSLCDSFTRSVGFFIDNSILRNFSMSFLPPFQEAFPLQANIQSIKLSLLNEPYLSFGKILFGDDHLKWKHKQNAENLQKELYKFVGVKRKVSANGVETWFGCAKGRPRCFGTVVDTPEYLYERRWTPPCCLENLRRTARHVFQTLEQRNFKYWLEGGSLLGAARYADIIPWDYDVDIGVFRDAIQSFPMLDSVWSRGERHIDRDGFVWERAKEGDFIRVQYSETNHLHVDIFPFYERNGVMTKDTWFKSHHQDMEFPAHYLDPLVQLRFAATVAWAPNHHKDFLELKFGRDCIKKPKYPFPEKLIDTHF